MTHTAALARYAAGLRWHDQPASVQAEAQRALLNWFGVALGGSTAPEHARILATLGQPGGAWMAGHARRLERGAAAVMNGLAASQDCFDDTHLATVIHPTAPVAAAALAAAAGRAVGGAELLAAVIAGDEIACRLGLALMGGPHPASLGWYMTGVVGTIGAAAAAGRVLGLTAAAMTSALGFAVAQAAGLRSAHASVMSPLVPGLAARNGLAAALLAEAGLTCHDGALEGPNGLLPTMAPGNPAAPLTEGLGARHAMLDLAYKPYPCGVAVHPAIDGCLAILARARPAPEEIARIEVTVDPLAERLCLREEVASPFDAQVSIAHWCAATLVAGRAGVEQARHVHDPAVVALRRRVVAIPDATLARDQARVALVLRGGTRLEAAVEHATGSVANPMDAAALRRKALDQAVPVLGVAAAARLLDRLDALPDLPDIAALLEAATPGA
ncbi:MmgE/PrpD family protein [Falsiroseomonas sp. CW058]|uniref:MmgE/PrpD family protein n=1 Tax=Falsiroseomonas sp. CW058 TaxID=3388664 RepID=UPI003D3144C9